MSTIKVDSIKSADGNTDLLTLSNGAVSGVIGGRRNLIINGDFQVAQRGTSFNPSSGFGYTLDRWQTYSYASSSATVSRQTFTLGQTDVPDSPRYFARVTGTSVRPYLEQRIESVSRFGGRTVTLSLWAKSSDVTDLAIDSFSYFGSGGSSTAVDNNNQSIGTLSSTWTKFTYTWTISSHSGKTIGDGNYYGVDITAVSGDVGTIDIALVQLEFGSVATPFEHRSYGEELALCQRYYWTTPNTVYGNAYGSGNSMGKIIFPTTMRATPSMTRTFGGGGTGSDQNLSKDLYQFYVSGDNSVYIDSVSADAEL